MMNRSITKSLFLSWVFTLSILFVSCSPDSTSVGNYGQVRSLGGTEIWVQERLQETLYHIYSATNKEVPICLHGVKKDSAIFVQSASIPHITGSTLTSSSIGYSQDDTARGDVYNETCTRRGNYLGLVHNHIDVKTQKQCVPSEQDFDRFKQTPRAELELVACSGEGVNLFFLGLARQDLKEEYR